MVPLKFVDADDIHIGAIDFPKTMVKIDLPNRTYEYVPYNNTVFSDDKSLNSSMKWHSENGLTEYRMRGYHMFDIRQPAEYPQLVSSCQHCQVNEAEYQLGGLFCSTNCQRKFRLNY